MYPTKIAGFLADSFDITVPRARCGPEPTLYMFVLTDGRSALTKPNTILNVLKYYF